ncbi:Lysine acetyltransferase [Lachnellula occidentalis]|uniref:Lysine acetyltransferase n=1 Tax=Lachnellula occidentalis TaxID=215460 RepID=A0A8H8UHK3_9HELO|nr:Lysine acetyltransferase [Lachnellula occidentalis]
MANYTGELPLASAPTLKLVHPTPKEKLDMWTENWKVWGTSLSLEDYIERETHLADIPPTRDGGVTHWILTDPTLPPDARPVLSFCESLRRRTFVSLPSGEAQEGIVHGIGSVFCAPAYRGRGYATRMLSDLGPILNTWQKEAGKSHFSILYSDIGKKYYTSMGWLPFASSHVSLPPAASPATNGGNGDKAEGVKLLYEEDLKELCELDESYLRNEVTKTAKSTNKPAVAIIPDQSTMTWHHLREQFMCSKMFPQKTPPTIHGAISTGEPGLRVWIIFSRVFYGPLANVKSGNTLYILRLVVEDETDTDENAQKLKSVLQVAQAEAKEWELSSVAAWNVGDVVKRLLKRTGLEYKFVDRENDSITSLMWYEDGKGDADSVEWVGNEKFAWC